MSYQQALSSDPGVHSGMEVQKHSELEVVDRCQDYDGNVKHDQNENVCGNPAHYADAFPSDPADSSSRKPWREWLAPAIIAALVASLLVGGAVGGGIGASLASCKASLR
jgi:hypothetical protein